MKIGDVRQILSDTAYVRTSGTPEEKRCAEYIKGLCEKMQLKASIEPFDITVYNVTAAELTVDGKQVKCAGFGGAGCGIADGGLYYLESGDRISLKKCKDKIVLVGKALDRKLYDALVEHGAKGLITFSGSMASEDRDVCEKELRFDLPKEKRLPAVHIHLSDALDLVKKKRVSAEIRLEQNSEIGRSHNVLLDFKGRIDETVIVCAHYDTTPNSVGAFDNMSGCIALLYLGEYFSQKQNLRNVRLLWCGSEERGLHGSFEYCRSHADELTSHVLNVNLDMLGVWMGEFVAFSCINEKVKDELSSFLAKHRFPGSARHAIRSSDSNSFLHHNVPAVSFARFAPSGFASVHSRYDVKSVVSEKQLLKDAKIIAKFTEYVANAPDLSEFSVISEEIRADVEKYMAGRLPAVRIK